MQILCVLIPHFALKCEIQKCPSLENCAAIVTCAAGSQRLVMDWSRDIKDMQPHCLEFWNIPSGNALCLPAECGYTAAGESCLHLEAVPRPKIGC